MFPRPSPPNPPQAPSPSRRRPHSTSWYRNKSSLAFRNDIGIPGYTGYIPTSGCVPVDPKGGTRREAKVLRTDHAEKLAATLPGVSDTVSVHRTTFPNHGNPDPSTLRAPAPDRRRVFAATPFTGTSTYRKEILAHDEKVDMIFSTRGSTPLTATHKPGREGPQAADHVFGRSLTGSLQAPTPQVGFVTTYGSMVVKEPKTGGLAAAGKPLLPSEVPAPRAGAGMRGLPVPMPSQTSYRRDFGGFQADPMARMPTSNMELTAHASTLELNAGAPASCRHIPGYAGHIPTLPSKAKGDSLRESMKVEMCHGPVVDQYSRGSLPGYGGFRPAAIPNVKTELGKAPVEVLSQTTSGMAQNIVRKPGPVDSSHFVSSAKGTGSFFSGGGLFVSDNGKSEAEKYYVNLRPLEGVSSMYVPSKTTDAGYKFSK